MEEIFMVFEKVKSIIAEQLGMSEDKIAPETSLMDDLGADSLDLFQIISNLEEEFNIEFAKESIEQMKTIADAVAFIDSRV